MFGDFQSAWSVRFPGCELPRSWEEDIRSNLDRHRTRVSLLKEELEKEEFYVQYLEGLLTDIEKSLLLDAKKSVPKPLPRTSILGSRTSSVSNESVGTSEEPFVTVINLSSSPKSEINLSSSPKSEKINLSCSPNSLVHEKTNVSASNSIVSTSSSSSSDKNGVLKENPRFPSGKVVGNFGTNIETVCK